jgi:6-phosphofructokinase 1
MLAPPVGRCCLRLLTQLEFPADPISSSGMNAATRAAIAYCFTRGHTPVMLHNGFSGLIRHHSDKPLGKRHRSLPILVSLIRFQAPCEMLPGWMPIHGSAKAVPRLARMCNHSCCPLISPDNVSRNRTLPSENMKEVSSVFDQYNIQALFLIGGFEAFTALSELRKARADFDTLKIPMIILPATVSNNVPGTEYSLGSDTCLNALIEFCDTCRQASIRLNWSGHDSNWSLSLLRLLGDVYLSLKLKAEKGKAAL